MSTTTTTATTTTAPTSSAAPRRLDERRIAGIGAIGFASVVILTNILQGATPAMDADADEVVSYITDHRTANIIATAAFAVAAPFLLAFASAFYGRLKTVGRAADLVWARLGMVGAVLILPTFTAVVVNRLVLLVGTDEIIGSPELVTLVWRIEMAAFVVNLLPIAVAVLGFGIAGARAGLLPAWYRRWAPFGAGCAIVAAANGVAGLEGSPIGFLGLVTFASWMLLLLLAGVRQLRSA